MRCAPESKEAGSCLKDLVPWCDATGARRVCCGRGLVPRDEAGLCGCAPGGTRAPEAIERGCSAPPDDADATYKKEHLAMFDRVVACFSPKITAKSIRGGKMGFQYALGPDGRVIASRLDQSDVPDEEAQRCALDRIQASRFTAPPEDRVGALRGFGFQLQD